MNPRGFAPGGCFLPPSPPIIDRVRVEFIDGKVAYYTCCDQEQAKRLARSLGEDKTLTVTLVDTNDKQYRFGLTLKVSLVPLNEHALVYDGDPMKVLPVVQRYFRFTDKGRKAFWKKGDSE